MKLAFILPIFLATSAQASIPVTFMLTSASSNALVQLLYGASAETRDAKCGVEVIRPVDQEDAIETKNQKLTCTWDKGIKTEVNEFVDSKIDSWGQRSDPRSFAVLGKAAESFFSKFQQKISSLTFPEPENSMWSRIYLCDTFGATCLQTVFLNSEATKDSAAQIACSRNSTLISKSDVSIDPSAYPSYPDYLNAFIEAQIQLGQRKVDPIFCVFIAP